MSDAAYQKRYRAAASSVWKAREDQRNKAWWRAHRALAKKYPAVFFELYEAEKEKLKNEVVRAAGERVAPAVDGRSDRQPG